jgi:hypothetical protein
LVAWQANLIAIVDCINREIVKPNRCTIGRVVDFSDSLHLYDNMSNIVEGLEFMPITQFPH